MFGGRVLRLAVREHLDLVELVHPDDAAGVLAIGAGFPPEARRPPRVTDGTGGQVEDLVRVVGRQRHLGGADQVEVVGFEAVHLGSMGAEKAGALHGLRLHQHRRDHRHEAVGQRLADREVEQGELQPGTDAPQKVEPGAGHLGAAFGVDGPQPLAQCEVVLRLEVEGGRLPDVLQHDVVVLATGRHAGFDDVRNGLVCGAQRLVGRRLGRFGALDLGGQLLAAGQQCRSVIGLRLTDGPPEGLLLGAQRVGGRDRSPAVHIGLQQRVDVGRRGPAGCLGCADEVGPVAEDAQVDHACEPIAARAAAPPLHSARDPQPFDASTPVAAGPSWCERTRLV